MSVEKIARRCLIGLALAGLLATGAWAQSDNSNSDLKNDKKDLRKDRKDLHKDRKDIRNDQKNLNRDRIDRNKDRRDLNKDQKDLAKDRRDLREDIKEGDKADAAKDRADIHGCSQGQERHPQGQERHPPRQARKINAPRFCAATRRPLRQIAAAFSLLGEGRHYASMVPSKIATAAPLTRGTNFPRSSITSTRIWLGRPISTPCTIWSCWFAPSFSWRTR